MPYPHLEEARKLPTIPDNRIHTLDPAMQVLVMGAGQAVFVHDDIRFIANVGTSFCNVMLVEAAGNTGMIHVPEPIALTATINKTRGGDTGIPAEILLFTAVSGKNSGFGNAEWELQEERFLRQILDFTPNTTLRHVALHTDMRSPSFVYDREAQTVFWAFGEADAALKSIQKTTINQEIGNLGPAGVVKILHDSIAPAKEQSGPENETAAERALREIRERRERMERGSGDRER